MFAGKSVISKVNIYSQRFLVKPLQAMIKILGVKPLYFRPPYGMFVCLGAEIVAQNLNHDFHRFSFHQTNHQGNTMMMWSVQFSI